MKIALFLSIGDNIEYPIDFYKTNLYNKCDLFINYYKSDNRIFNILKQYSKFAINYYTTKFPALKIIYNMSRLFTYDYVFIFDDDFIIEKGNLFEIISIMDSNNIDICSGCHSFDGKISHDIMKYCKNTNIFRYTNFVEMNFPVFSKYALQQYMKIYDGNLSGWGNDWWYLNTLNCNVNKNCAIVDSVCIKNPHKNNSSINDFMKLNDRINQWNYIKNKYQLKEWQQKNIEFV